MYVVYTDLEEGNLKALEYLGKKYKGKSSDFAVVASGTGCCSSNEGAEQAVRKFLPNCLFAFKDAWKIKSVIGQVKRMYCMSNVVWFAFDLEELGYCKQVYVLMGETHEDDGWENDPHTDRLAYKYVRDNLYGCSMQVSYEEARARSRLMGEEDCPELQFMKIVESLQGFMFHLFSCAGYVLSNDVCKVLRIAVKRVNGTFEVRGQKCEVCYMICQVMDRLRRDATYQTMLPTEKTVAGACAFFYVMMQGMDTAQAICNAKAMLEKLGLECLEKRVVWFMMHCNDFNERMSLDACKVQVWKNDHEVNGNVNVRALALFEYDGRSEITEEEHARQMGKVYLAKMIPTKQMYDDIFLVKRAEIKGHADIPKVWIRDIAYDQWLRLEARIKQALGARNVRAGASTVFN